MSKLIEQETELDRMLKSGQDFLVLFYASWCPYSARFLPVFEKHSAGGERNCARVVIDELDSVIDKYDIKVYPTVLFFKNGKVARRLDGVAGLGLDEKKLLDFFNVCGY